MKIPWLEPDDPLPPPERALRRPNGLLAAGGGLSMTRLVDAYSRGCFPWFNPGEPILWWTPDPRMVLVPGDLRIARSMAKTLRKADFEVRADSAFEQVIQACSEPRSRQKGTWITAEMQTAYTRLHRLGVAHSIETWRCGELVGGLYGVALGRVFFGESMFSRATDASKIALVHLVRQLHAWEFELIDCQMHTPLLFAHVRRPGNPQSRLPGPACALTGATSHQGPWTLDADCWRS
jgi:leucyl/phenylalanyl-tRNA--protein transferase